MRIEDEIEFDRRMRELRRALYELAGWLDKRGLAGSVMQCGEVLEALDGLRATFSIDSIGEDDE